MSQVNDEIMEGYRNVEYMYNFVWSFMLLNPKSNYLLEQPLLIHGNLSCSYSLCLGKKQNKVNILFIVKTKLCSMKPCELSETIFQCGTFWYLILHTFLFQMQMNIDCHLGKKL